MKIWLIFLVVTCFVTLSTQKQIQNLRTSEGSVVYFNVGGDDIEVEIDREGKAKLHLSSPTPSSPFVAKIQEKKNAAYWLGHNKHTNMPWPLIIEDHGDYPLGFLESVQTPMPNIQLMSIPEEFLNDLRAVKYGWGLECAKYFQEHLVARLNHATFKDAPANIEHLLNLKFSKTSGCQALVNTFDNLRAYNSEVFARAVPQEEPKSKTITTISNASFWSEYNGYKGYPWPLDIEEKQDYPFDLDHHVLRMRNADLVGLSTVMRHTYHGDELFCMRYYQEHLVARLNQATFGDASVFVMNELERNFEAENSCPEYGLHVLREFNNQMRIFEVSPLTPTKGKFKRNYSPNLPSIVRDLDYWKKHTKYTDIPWPIKDYEDKYEDIGFTVGSNRKFTNHVILQEDFDSTDGIPVIDRVGGRFIQQKIVARLNFKVLENTPDEFFDLVKKILEEDKFTTQNYVILKAFNEVARPLKIFQDAIHLYPESLIVRSFLKKQKEEEKKPTLCSKPSEPCAPAEYCDGRSPTCGFEPEIRACNPAHSPCDPPESHEVHTMDIDPPHWRMKAPPSKKEEEVVIEIKPNWGLIISCGMFIFLGCYFNSPFWELFGITILFFHPIWAVIISFCFKDQFNTLRPARQQEETPAPQEEVKKKKEKKEKKEKKKKEKKQ
jgi:hypothetical protein